MRVRLVNLQAPDDTVPTVLPNVGMVRLSLLLGKATLYDDFDGITLHLWEDFVVRGEADTREFAYKRALVEPRGGTP